MRAIKWCVFHCTAGPQNQSIDSITKYWYNTLKWRNPGYHRIIKANGEIVELLPYDKISNGVGPGVNGISINIAYIGGVDRNMKAIDNRTDAQKKSMEKLAREIKEMYPDVIFMGHRDFSEDKNGNGKIDTWERIKECPCFEVSDWIKSCKI